MQTIVLKRDWSVFDLIACVETYAKIFSYDIQRNVIEESSGEKIAIGAFEKMLHFAPPAICVFQKPLHGHHIWADTSTYEWRYSNKGGAFEPVDVEDVYDVICRCFFVNGHLITDRVK